MLSAFVGPLSTLSKGLWVLTVVLLSHLWQWATKRSRTYNLFFFPFLFHVLVHRVSCLDKEPFTPFTCVLYLNATLSSHNQFRFCVWHSIWLLFTCQTSVVASLTGVLEQLDKHCFYSSTPCKSATLQCFWYHVVLVIFIGAYLL